MYPRAMKSVVTAVAAACVGLAPAMLTGQAVPSARGPRFDPAAPKWDVFVGYSYLAPKGTVDTPTPGGIVYANSYTTVNNGQIVSASYFLNRILGVQAEVGVHEWGVTSPSNFIGNGTEGNNDGFLSTSGGLIARYPMPRFTPFLHVLGGETLVDGPLHNPYTWGPSVTGGGGIDVQTPWWNHRLSIRLFQVDYEYMHVNFGTGNWGGLANINAMRASAGIVFHRGSYEVHEGLSVACMASPNVVYPGDPVTLSAETGGVEPKEDVVYSWSGEGVTGSGSSISISTGSLAPGVHTVDCQAKSGRPGREGLRASNRATSSASFTVKVFDPPSVSCNASPSTIKPGETATITAMGVSPQNRPLTYTYSAAAGSVSGTGSSAVFSSTGAPTGTTAINCSVSDDKGQTASASTTVTISAPYVPPAPRVEALCSITFTKDRMRPTRVDNEAKACLDEVALDLQRQPDAKAVLVGNATTAEKIAATSGKKNIVAVDLAAERAVNTKAYLVGEKGIDASRIVVVTGTAEASSVEDYLAPAGAVYTSDLTGITAVDESIVKPQARTPLPVRHASRKAKAAAAK